MNSGQTLLTLGAFVLLMTMLTNFWQLLALSGTNMNQSEADIAEVALATSYNQFAQGLCYDEATIDSFMTTATMGTLTAVSRLGVDNPPPSGEPTEASMTSFDDFDDFNNYQLDDSSLIGSVGVFHSNFKVYYVSPTDLNSVSTTPTFVKRMDVTIYRTVPPSKDTLRTSFTLGYFHFD